jgi:hypothetical protein
METSLAKQGSANKTFWYLVTVSGFAFGFLAGSYFLLPSQPWHGPWLESIFWAFPASGAGLTMGIGQAIFLRRRYKYAFLWFMVTTIGIIGVAGGILLLTMLLSYSLNGGVSNFLGLFADEAVPLVIVFTIISPIAIFLGPVCQWLIIRKLVEDTRVIELIKLSVAWILAFPLFIFILAVSQELFRSRSDLVNSLILILCAIPSGLLFAKATVATITNPLNSRKV